MALVYLVDMNHLGEFIARYSTDINCYIEVR